MADKQNYRLNEDEQTKLEFLTRRAVGYGVLSTLVSLLVLALAVGDFSWMILFTGLIPSLLLWRVTNLLGKRSRRTYYVMASIGLTCMIGALPPLLAFVYLAQSHALAGIHALLYAGLVIGLLFAVFEYGAARRQFRAARQKQAADGLVRPDIGLWSLRTYIDPAWEDRDESKPNPCWSVAHWLIILIPGLIFISIWTNVETAILTMLMCMGGILATVQGARSIAFAVEIRLQEVQHQTTFFVP